MKSLMSLAAGVVLVVLSTGAASAGVCNQNSCSTRLMGVVSSGAAGDAKPVRNAHVAIFRASNGAPQLIGEATTNARGQFSVPLPQQGLAETRFAVAADGRTELMTVMSPTDRPHVRINEMTTVASAYAMAQFFDGKDIVGKDLPLQIAAGMFRNLAAPDRGEVSDVLRRSPNGDETNARRLMATLSNVLANCIRKGAIDSCLPLFSATGGTTTLEAAIAIAHNPANKVHEIFALSNVVQPFRPALTADMGPDAANELMRLDAFTVAVKVNRTGNTGRRGRESCPFGGAGNLVFDDKGYAWITNNVVQGTTGSANCFMVLKPDGTPADGMGGTPSSPISGGGVLGQGFGIGRDPSGNIWAGNFGWGGVNPVGSVSKFASDGKALSPSSGYVATLDRVQGTTSDQNGNIWMASYGNSKVLLFKNGDPFIGNASYADANTEPFHIVIDDNGAAFVSYTGTSALNKLSYDGSAISQVATAAIGTSANPKGIGLDTEGNVWATAGAESKVYLFDNDLNPKGSFNGGGITGPWGLSVDSHDNVWVANFGPPEQLDLKYRLTQLCGTDTSHCPPGFVTGDGISPATGWTLPSAGAQVRLANGKPLYYPLNQPSYKPLMRATATQVDMAGNVWVTNNWKPSGANDLVLNPGGDGMVIFVGMAAPVQPGIGQPKAP